MMLKTLISVVLLSQLIFSAETSPPSSDTSAVAILAEIRSLREFVQSSIVHQGRLMTLLERIRQQREVAAHSTAELQSAKSQLESIRQDMKRMEDNITQIVEEIKVNPQVQEQLGKQLVFAKESLKSLQVSHLQATATIADREADAVREREKLDALLQRLDTTESQGGSPQSVKP
jgi:chromosome segregation ATPase